MPKAKSSSGTGALSASTGLLESAMTTKRSAAAATIFSRRWAPPPPLISQPSGVDLVGAVDRDVEPLQLAELLDRDAQLARLFLGGDRGGDAADVADPAGRDRRQQVGDRRSGAQPHGHPVLDQLRRRFGGDALLGVDAITAPHSTQVRCNVFRFPQGHNALHLIDLCSPTRWTRESG